MRNGDSGPAGGLPKHTTPTWEVELLISGVAVFAMLQLPGLLDDAVFAVRPRFSDWMGIVDVIYIYSKSAAVMLAATFVVHLVLRARWIALVGMHSIYPDGILWDRLRLGPYTRRAEEKRIGAIADAIERADNRATTVFAIGVSLALLLVMLTLSVALLFGVSIALGARPTLDTVALLIALLIVPYGLSQVVDRRWGERLRQDSLGGKLLAGVLGAYAAAGFGNTRNAALGMLASHGGRRRVVLATAVLMMTAILGVSAVYYAMRAEKPLGNYAAFPISGDMHPASLDPRHYADRRDAVRDGQAPFVPSMFVRGPYLEVTVPYQPALDENAMHDACPAVANRPEGAARIAASLECLSRIHALRLDGKPLPVRFETGSDPATGRPALVAMVDVRALAPGRHELRTARLDAHDDEPKVHVIPFWR
jgi:hypothetical protein